MSSKNAVEQIILFEEPATTFVNTHGVAQVGYRQTVAEIERGIGGEVTSIRHVIDIRFGVVF